MPLSRTDKIVIFKVKTFLDGGSAEIQTNWGTIYKTSKLGQPKTYMLNNFEIKDDEMIDNIEKTIKKHKENQNSLKFMSINKIQELIAFHKETKAEVFEVLNMMNGIPLNQTGVLDKYKLEFEYELRSSFINQLEDLL